MANLPTRTKYYVKTARAGCYLVSAGYGFSKWTEDFDDATPYDSIGRAINAQAMASRSESEPTRIVSCPE